MSALDGLVTIITGAASGLGEATARRFAAGGARLILSDIQAERGAALAAELGGSFAPCDVTDEAQVAALVDGAIARHGRLDCIINNAGHLGALGSITEIPAQAWDSTIAILLNSVFYGVKHAARVMRPQRGGCILSTTSVGGIAPLGPHAYTTAKHAVVGLTRSAASELAEYGVRVNAVAPGRVQTKMTELAYGSAARMQEVTAQQNPIPRVVQADEIAGAFAYLAGSDGLNITGQVLAVDAGMSMCRLDSSYYAKPAAYVGALGPEGR